MSQLRRLQLFCNTRRLGGAARAAVAALLVVAGLAQPGTAPILAAPIPAPQTCSPVVSNNHDNGAGSLREAVTCPPSNRTITFAIGVPHSTILLTSGEIPITQSLTINGSGAPGVKVDAGNTSRVFNITASGPVTLTVLTLQHGRAASGNGGAVLAGASGPLVLIKMQVLSSTASAGRGGGLYAVGTLTLISTDFISDTSTFNGGGVYNVGGAVVTNGRFQSDRCTGSTCFGGGLSVFSTLTLTGTDFISNTSAGEAGGAYVYSAVLTNGHFQGNQCSGSNCRGGGLHADANLSLTGTDFISNTSAGDGGGVWADDAAALTNDRFEGNACTDAGCLGGGLWAFGNAPVLSSSFSGNQSAGSGGGVGITNTAQITLANVTLSGNMASIAGGGLYAGGASQASLWNVTVADNQAPSGGGVRGEPGATLVVANTLFSNNGAANCSGPISAGTHNLEWPGAACATAGPIAGFSTADPLLEPLALNAPGATLTRALLNTSPARDHGEAAICAAPPVNNLDQRGVVRPLDSDLVPGAICDIGAYEAGAPVLLVFLPLVRR